MSNGVITCQVYAITCQVDVLCFHVPVLPRIGPILYPPWLDLFKFYVLHAGFPRVAHLFLFLSFADDP